MLSLIKEPGEEKIWNFRNEVKVKKNVKQKDKRVHTMREFMCTENAGEAFYICFYVNYAVCLRFSSEDAFERFQDFVYPFDTC